MQTKNEKNKVIIKQQQEENIKIFPLSKIDKSLEIAARHQKLIYLICNYSIFIMNR